MAAVANDFVVVWLILVEWWSGGVVERLTGRLSEWWNDCAVE